MTRAELVPEIEPLVSDEPAAAAWRGILPLAYLDAGDPDVLGLQHPTHSRIHPVRVPLVGRGHEARRIVLWTPRRGGPGPVENAPGCPDRPGRGLLGCGLFSTDAKTNAFLQSLVELGQEEHNSSESGGGQGFARIAGPRS